MYSTIWVQEVAKWCEKIKIYSWFSHLTYGWSIRFMLRVFYMILRSVLELRWETIILIAFHLHCRHFNFVNSHCPNFCINFHVIFLWDVIIFLLLIFFRPIIEILALPTRRASPALAKTFYCEVDRGSDRIGDGELDQRAHLPLAARNLPGGRARFCRRSRRSSRTAPA